MACAVLAWLWHAAPDLTLLSRLWGSWPLLLAALGLAVGVQVLGAWRWERILAVMGETRSQWEVQRVCWGASFLNQALLGTVGGDAYRCTRLAAQGDLRLSALLASVLLDRLSGLWLALVLALSCWPLAPLLGRVGTGLEVWLAWIAVAVVLIPLFAWAVYKKVQQRADSGAAQLLRTFAADRAAWCWMLGLGLVVQALVVGVHLLLAQALFPALHVDPWLWFVMVPVAIGLISLPIHPPGAIGTAEACYQFLFGLVGVADAAVLALALRLVLVLQSLPGAWFLIRGRRHVRGSPGRG